MRQRTYHTPMSQLLKPEMYQRIKMISSIEGIPMSQFIREGIQLRIDQHDKENNTMTIENSTDEE